MAPRKVTGKPNGFLIFMQEMKVRFERDGHNFPNGLQDLLPTCSAMWNDKTAEQKEFYNNNAKGLREAANKSEEEKWNAQGTQLSSKAREEQVKFQNKKEESESIEKLISYLHQRGALVNFNFHFANFNYAVVTDEKESPPCEVAIVKFSLANGISHDYHEIINPGKIPQGYSYEAKKLARITHVLAPDFVSSNANYVEITNALKKIIRQSDGNFAPIFFVESEIPKAKFSLEWLVEKCFGLDPNYERVMFRAYSLNKLLYELCRHANLKDSSLQFTSYDMVAKKLCSGMFLLSPNMACWWHHCKDRTKYCSLTIVRNYAFIISDVCCKHYGFRLLPKRHYPADEPKYLIKPPADPRKPDDKFSDTSNLDTSLGSATRIPRHFGHVSSRLAANLGIGRDLMASSSLNLVNNCTTQKVLSSAPSAPASSSSPPFMPTIGRGRGRGILFAGSTGTIANTTEFLSSAPSSPGISSAPPSMPTIGRGRGRGILGV